MGSRSPENKLQEVYISNSNNTNINNDVGVKSPSIVP